MSQLQRETISKIRGQLMECAGWDGDRISSDRKRAHDYYHMRPRGDEVRGRSNVVSGDLSAMTESNLAQMLEAFTHDAIAEFDATGPEDDDQAALESHAVNAAVMKDNNGHQELGAAIKDGLLLRNGWVKPYVEITEHTESKTLNNANHETIAALREEIDGTVRVLEYDKDANRAEVRITKTVKRFICESVDPADVLYPKQWNKLDVQEVPFIAIRHVEARSELLRRGFPKAKVNRLKAYNMDTKIDSLARDVGETGMLPHAIDSSQDLIEWFECYVLMDSGDGTSERRRVAITGANYTTWLENEPASLVPLATGSPFINPHRLTGISLFDKLFQNQDINTGLKRALLDNVNTVIKNRIAYLDGKVNTDDLEDGRPNGSVRVKANVGDVRTALYAFNTPDLSQGILANLEASRKERTEMGGASLDLATGQMQLSGGRVGSQGVDRAFSVMEMLAAHMCKNMATSLVRNVFLVAHATLREHFDSPINVKINGRWKSPVPSDWQPRTRLTVKIGMSPGERARREAAQRNILDTQLTLADKGMDRVLVNIEGFYKALTDWGRAAEVPNPEQYYIDPSTPESQQALAQKEQQRAEEAEASRNLMGIAVGLEQIRTSIDKYKADQDTAFKYWSETLRAEIEEAKIVGQATADLIKQTKFGDNGNGEETRERTGQTRGARANGEGSDNADQP